jgi:hypothetical protein
MIPVITSSAQLPGGVRRLPQVQVLEGAEASGPAHGDQVDQPDRYRQQYHERSSCHFPTRAEVK